MSLGFILTGMMIGLGAGVWALATGGGILAAIALYAGVGVLASLTMAGGWLLCPVVMPWLRGDRVPETRG